MTIEEQDAYRIAIAEAAGIAQFSHCIPNGTHREMATTAVHLAAALGDPSLHRHRTSG